MNANTKFGSLGKASSARKSMHTPATNILRSSQLCGTSIGAVQQKEREVVPGFRWCCRHIRIFSSASYAALPLSAALLACYKRWFAAGPAQL